MRESQHHQGQVEHQEFFVEVRTLPHSKPKFSFERDVSKL
jgi:hypothetical protein